MAEEERLQEGWALAQVVELEPSSGEAAEQPTAATEEPLLVAGGAPAATDEPLLDAEVAPGAAILEPNPAESEAAESLPERATRRPPHPLWRVAVALLTLMLMAGAAWAGYEGLVYMAGPSLQNPAPPFDLQGFAGLTNIEARPLTEAEGDGVLVTWTAQNLGSNNWLSSTHHWEPLYADLPPLPLPRPIKPGDSAKMAVRLAPGAGPVVGWRLMGLKGPVQDGQFEVRISTADERK